MRNTAQTSLISFTFIAVNNVLRCFTETLSLKKERGKKPLNRKNLSSRPGSNGEPGPADGRTKKEEKGEVGQGQKFL